MRCECGVPVGSPECNLRAHRGHRVVSVDGWTCDVCGRGVNGQTDADGRPTIEGDSVRHVASTSGGAS